MSQKVMCPNCGAVMTEIGTEGKYIMYHCRNCGEDKNVEITEDDSVTILHRRNLLLGKVRRGIIDWEVTQWDALREEINKFTEAYHTARSDIYFDMAEIACITKGFHDLDDTRYKECKRIFKLTERVYKRYIKSGGELPTEMNLGTAKEYEEYRDMYKKCRYDYQSKKLLYKALFTIGKKIIPIPKL